MKMRKYEFVIGECMREGTYLGTVVTEYKDDDGSFVTNKPETNEESREIIKSMKSLAKLLNPNKLRVKLEIE